MTRNSTAQGEPRRTLGKTDTVRLPAVVLLATFLLATTLLAAMLLGVAPAAAEDPCGPIRFRETAGESGLVFRHDPGGQGKKHLPESMGAGLAWLDYDGDGWWDLYAVQSGPFPPDGSAAARDRLFRNLGPGSEGSGGDGHVRFEDVSERARIHERRGSAHGYGQGVLAADLDGDGHTDLYLTNFGPDVVLRNRGDGTFEDATERFGLGLDGWSSSAAAADFDGDGDLDLYVTRYLVYDPSQELFCGDLEQGLRRYCDPVLFEGGADRFFENHGRFKDATSSAGLGGANGKGLGVVFTDLDGDARPDLYVANDLTANLLFRNVVTEDKGAVFEDVSLLSGAAANREGLYEAGMGIAVGDLEGDGDPDLVVTNFDVETNTLYENQGALQFDDVSARRGFGVPSFNLLGFGIALADFDRDGHLDAWIANGHIFEQPMREHVTQAQRDLLLRGDGRGGFTELACPPLAARPYVGRGLAVADPDNDGDLDVAISNNGGPLQLWSNESAAAPWLGVRLVGAGLNPEAVGARLEAAGTGGHLQPRWVLAGDSYQSSSDRRLLFAALAHPVVLGVVWPSGHRWKLVDPPAGRYLVVPQGASSGAVRAGLLESP